MEAGYPVLALTLAAAGPVEAHRCVTLAGAQATAQGAKMRGVAQYDAGDGQAFAATLNGIAVIEAGAAIAKDDALICDAQGRVIPATGAADEYVLGDALDAAVGAGSFLQVLLR